MPYIACMTRPIEYPEHIQVKVPKGTLAAINKARGATPLAEFLRRAILNAIKPKEEAP
jgi:hypothetical protein